MSLYFDPKSPTFSNALQSGIKAGYTEKYAANILDRMPEWLREKVENNQASRMLEKAERNLDEILDLPSKVQAMAAFGPLWEGKGKKKKPLMTYSGTLIKIKNDASQFVAERLGRKKYSDNKKDGPTLNFNFYDGKQLKRVAARIHNDESESPAISD